MFDLSLVELAVIALVALLVLGPERLPKAARTVGLYARKARQSWYVVKSDIERELAADELKRSVQAQADAAQRSVRALQREIGGPIDSGDALDAGTSTPTSPRTPDTDASASPSSPQRDEPPPDGR